MKKPSKNLALGLLLSFLPLSTTCAAALSSSEAPPSLYEFACFASHAYKDNVSPNSPVAHRDPNSTSYALNEWQVVTSFRDDQGWRGGYRGVLCYNNTKRQVVLAHRGTTGNIDAIKTDALAIALGWTDGQAKVLPKYLKKSLQFAQSKHASFYITGHSLGGWLAQVSMFILQTDLAQEETLQAVKQQAPIRCITFDTPGAGGRFVLYRNKNAQLSQAHITNYLSAPNPVNSCEAHIGICYRLVFDFQNDMMLNVTSHFMANFFLRLQTHQYALHHIKKWPRIWVEKQADDILNNCEQTSFLSSLFHTGMPFYAIFNRLILQTKTHEKESYSDLSGDPDMVYLAKKYSYAPSEVPHLHDHDATKLIESNPVAANYNFRKKVGQKILAYLAKKAGESGYGGLSQNLGLLSNNFPQVVDISQHASQIYSLFQQFSSITQPTGQNQPFAMDGFTLPTFSSPQPLQANNQNAGNPSAPSHPVTHNAFNPFTAVASSVAPQGGNAIAFTAAMGDAVKTVAKLNVINTGIEELGATLRTGITGYVDYKKEQEKTKQVKIIEESKRKLARVQGEEQRKNMKEQGKQQRANIKVAGAQKRKIIKEQGQEERTTIQLVHHTQMAMEDKKFEHTKVLISHKGHIVQQTQRALFEQKTTLAEQVHYHKQTEIDREEEAKKSVITHEYNKKKRVFP